MKELVCIVCPKGCHLKVYEEKDYAVEGYSCPRGKEYGKNEMQNPTRVITSTVRAVGGIHPRLSVKTERPIPKGKIFDALKELDNVEVKAPVKLGEVVLKDICGTGISVVSTRNLPIKEKTK